MEKVLIPMIAGSEVWIVTMRVALSTVTTVSSVMSTGCTSEYVNKKSEQSLLVVKASKMTVVAGAPVVYDCCGRLLAVIES